MLWVSQHPVYVHSGVHGLGGLMGDIPTFLFPIYSALYSTARIPTPGIPVQENVKYWT